MCGKDRTKIAKRPIARSVATGNDRQAYRTFDKFFWGDGPWQGELDKVVWTDAATGLDCMHRRCADGGYLCGYVAVEPSHPLFGYQHDAIPAALGVTAHTGLVESGLCDAGREDEVMCHIPAEGRPHDVWWFGFKCDKSGDHLPASQGLGPDQSGIYRSTEYVRAECERLALRLSEVARDCAPPPALPAPLPIAVPDVDRARVHA